MNNLGKIISSFVLICLFTCSESKQYESLTFLHTQNHDILNEKGEKVYLMGVGLGNWLLPEGYMWKFGEEGDRPRKIEKIVNDLIGLQNAKEFWTEFRKNYINESDIKRIAELGFNSVRPALNSRLFLTEGENPEFIQDGFLLLDNLVSWCKKYKLYVIIDMHGAPGGQTGQNIDDSPNDLPELFIDNKNQDLLVELWIKIAQRYKNEPTVAAYDLLNEPLPAFNSSADKYKHLLVPLYNRLITEIRKVDAKHMITLEGFNWSNDWSLFEKPLSENIFYQFHYYCWDKPDKLKDISYFLNKREQLNTPVWAGETGEKENTIYWATAQYFKENNIGFSFWPWKKMDTHNTPYSIKKPENWDLIAEYSRGGAKPDSVIATKAFSELLNNIKLENCDYYEDVVNAIFNRIPAKIQAENYGHKGYNKSFYVSDTSISSKYYRVDEPVLIEPLDSVNNNYISGQYIVLQKDEWTKYNFFSETSEKYKIVLKIRSEALSSKVMITVNKETIILKIDKAGWNEMEIGMFKFDVGENYLKISAPELTLNIDWVAIQD